MKLISAHMKPSLIKEFELYQGGPRHYHGMKSMPVLDGVDEFFKHPSVMETIRQIHSRRYAKGGLVRAAKLNPERRAQLSRLKRSGRHGDTEIALITPHMAQCMDHLIGGPSKNPVTGHREYFLGQLLSTLAPMAIGGLMGGIQGSQTPGSDFGSGMLQGLTGMPMGGQQGGQQMSGVPNDPYAQASNWMANKPMGVTHMSNNQMGFQSPATMGKMGYQPRRM